MLQKVKNHCHILNPGKITYLIREEDHWHLFGRALEEVWNYLNPLDFQRYLRHYYCYCLGCTVVVDAVAVVVVAVVDGLIHSKCDYPEKQGYKNVIKWRSNKKYCIK